METGMPPSLQMCSVLRHCHEGVGCGLALILMLLWLLGPKKSPAISLLLEEDSQGPGWVLSESIKMVQRLHHLHFPKEARTPAFLRDNVEVVAEAQPVARSRTWPCLPPWGEEPEEVQVGIWRQLGYCTRWPHSSCMYNTKMKVLLGKAIAWKDADRSQQLQKFFQGSEVLP